MDYEKIREEHPDTMSLHRASKYMGTTQKRLEFAAIRGELPFVVNLALPGTDPYYKVVTERFIRYMQGKDMESGSNEKVVRSIIAEVFQHLGGITL